MKHLFAGSAIAAILATGAFAASDADMNAIRTYAPDAQFEGMTDAEIAALAGIANGGGSEGDKRTQINAAFNDDNTVVTEVTSGELARLQSYAPELDFTGITASHLEQALGIIDSASSRSEAIAQLRSFTASDPVMDAPMFSENELNSIAAIDAGFDPSTLDDAQRSQLQAAIASGDDEQVRTVIDSFGG